MTSRICNQSFSFAFSADPQNKIGRAGPCPRLSYGRKLPRMFNNIENSSRSFGTFEWYFHRKEVLIYSKKVAKPYFKVILDIIFTVLIHFPKKNLPFCYKMLLLSTTFRLLRELFRVSSLTAAVAFSRLFFRKFWRDIFQFFGNFGTPPTPWVTSDLFVCEPVPLGRLQIQVNQQPWRRYYPSNFKNICRYLSRADLAELGRWQTGKIFIFRTVILFPSLYYRKSSVKSLGFYVSPAFFRLCCHSWISKNFTPPPKWLFALQQKIGHRAAYY